MGPRMSLNTDLEKIFSMYANQVSEKTSLKNKSEKEKHGNNYKKQSSKLSNDAYVSSLKGSEKIKKKLIFKKCLNQYIEDSDSKFSKHILYLG